MEILINLLIVLSVTIIALSFHEFGHFIAGVIFKVNIVEYSIGVGPSLFYFRIKGIKFSLRMFLIGAFVLFDSHDLRKNTIEVVKQVNLLGVDREKLKWTRWQHFKWIHKWGNYTIDNWIEYRKLGNYFKYKFIFTPKNEKYFYFNEISFYKKIIILFAGIFSNLVLFAVFFGISQINESTGQFQINNLGNIFLSVLQSLVFYKSNFSLDLGTTNLEQFIILSIIFNIIIAAFNSLPFPPLDMFKILTESYEKISGKKISILFENIFQWFGIAFILYATFVPIITIIIK